MFERLKENFKNGIERLRWFASVLSERLNIEIAVIKLLYRSEEMQKKKDELLKSIGARVYELRANPDKNILKDKAVSEAMEAIEKIEKDIDELKQKVSEMGSVRT